ATSAQVYASEGEKPVIADKQPITGPSREDLGGVWRMMPRPNTIFTPTPVTRVLHDGDVLDEVMGGLHVVATPGHAPDHIAFWQPARGILFCGDVMMSLRPRKLRLPIRFVTTNMAQNIRSIHRVASLNVQVLCLG